MKQLQSITGPQYFGTSKKKSCFEDFDKSLPGPGAHTPIPSPIISHPEWKIGNSTNRQGFLDPHRANIPSPQDYKVSHQAIEKTSKKAIIPESVYQPKPSSTSLSGFYSTNHHFTKNKNPQFSFGYFQQSNYNTLAPGPGAYEHIKKTVSLNKTQSGFSTAQRPLPYGEEARFPPPTKYSTISFQNTSKYSFGRSQRQQKERNQPPARFYDLQPKKPTPKVWRGNSTEYKRQPAFLVPNQYPAPSTYHIEINRKIPNGVIQTSHRKPIQSAEVVLNPSPDKYSAHGDFNHHGLTFYKEKRHLQPEYKQTPGPGTYEPMPTLSKIGGAISKKKPEDEEEKFYLPAATTYKPKDDITKKKVCSTVVLKANRTDFSKTITGIIGPGEYNINKSSENELGKMGRSHRDDIHSPNRNPGVGNYNIPNSIGQLPKYCTSPKKITEAGYSTFHEKLKIRLMQKQRMQRSLRLQKQSSSISENKKQAVDSNPQQIQHHQ